MLFGELQRQGVKAADAFYCQQQSLVTLQARRCQEVCYLVLDGIDIFYEQAEFSLLSLGRQPEFGLLRIEPQLALFELAILSTLFGSHFLESQPVDVLAGSVIEQPVVAPVACRPASP